MEKTGRNEPCPCGSGLKHKKCCALKGKRTPLSLRIVAGVVAILLVGGLIVFATSIGDHDFSTSSTAGRVWSEEHGHWH